MRKKNNDNNSQNLLMNKITVNKKANILNKTLCVDTRKLGNNLENCIDIF